jgi:signal transduction histidine kinase
MDKSSARKQEVLGAINDRQVAGLRLFLSVTGLIAIYIDPSEPDYFVSLAYGALIIYTLYSAGIYYAATRVETFPRKDNEWLVWTDLFLYSLLISLSGGTNSVFFWFYFFAILVACSRLGPRVGLSMTFVATAVFFAQAYFSKPSEVQFNRLLLRPACLVALGYILTYWSSTEQRLRRKLELLREVSLTSNPRFGVDHTASQLMQRVLQFFKADTCVLLEPEPLTDDFSMRRASVWDSGTVARNFELPPHLRNALPGVGQGAVLYNGPVRGWKRFNTYRVLNATTQVAGSRPLDEALHLADWLGCRSFMAVPLRHHEWLRGYLFVSAGRPAAFRMDDAKFLLQVADQVTPVLEHIRLVDHMASDAADDERRRIARSVHDRVIQPYIGLHMGLTGVRRVIGKVLQSVDGASSSAESSRALASLDSVVEMARQGVDELRQYVSDLRQTKSRGDVLLNSLLRYASRFETVTGMRVSVRADGIDSWNLNDRLAGEIFQMATEALSNVHRHTTATAVSLSIERNNSGSVNVRIENEIPEQPAQADFTPRSIAERATSLGGRTQVSTSEGRTVVNIEIPL